MTPESSFVQKVRALPERERLVWASVRILGQSKKHVASLHGISEERLDEMLVQIERRIGLA